MTTYKKTLLLLTANISKDFFSEPHSSNVEKAASNLFSIFIKQVKENSEEETMYMMLKILVAEVMMVKGAKTNGHIKTDA
jgi:hypothetical protein